MGDALKRDRYYTHTHTYIHTDTRIHTHMRRLTSTATKRRDSLEAEHIENRNANRNRHIFFKIKNILQFLFCLV